MNDDGKMVLANFDNWLAEEREYWKTATRHPSFDPDKYFAEKLKQRDEILAEFPHVACVEAFEPTLSYASRWCWQNFGPSHGTCGSYVEEYPACPLILATEFIQKGTYKDKSGDVHEWEEKEYKTVESHQHEGVWRAVSIDKTGYDRFVMEYYFKSEADLLKFLEAVPTFDVGEKYRGRSDVTER